MKLQKYLVATTNSTWKFTTTKHLFCYANIFLLHLFPSNIHQELISYFSETKKYLLALFSAERISCDN